jgi:hypothetical protein
MKTPGLKEVTSLRYFNCLRIRRRFGEPGSHYGDRTAFNRRTMKGKNELLSQFTKKDQQMHLKSILKTHTKTLKSPYMFRSTTIFREHTWYLADY